MSYYSLSNINHIQGDTLDIIDDVISKLRAIHNYYTNVSSQNIDTTIMVNVNDMVYDINNTLFQCLHYLPDLRLPHPQPPQPQPPHPQPPQPSTSAQTQTFVSNNNSVGVEVVTTITTTSSNDLPESLMGLVRDLIGSSPFGDLDLTQITQPQEDVMIGLDKSTIRQMRTKRYKSPTRDERQVESCCICLEDYKRRDKLRVLPCKHEFHKKCIDTWFSDHVKCPICRLDVREKLRII